MLTANKQMSTFWNSNNLGKKCLIFFYEREIVKAHSHTSNTPLAICYVRRFAKRPGTFTVSAVVLIGVPLDHIPSCMFAACASSSWHAPAKSPATYVIARLDSGKEREKKPERRLLYVYFQQVLVSDCMEMLPSESNRFKSLSLPFSSKMKKIEKKSTRVTRSKMRESVCDTPSNRF